MPPRDNRGRSGGRPQRPARDDARSRRSGDRTGGRSDDRSGGRPNDRSGGRPNDRSGGGRPNDRSGGGGPNDRSGGTSGDRSGGRFNDRSGDRTGGRSDDRSGGRPNDRSGGRPNDRSGGRSGDRTGGRPNDRAGGRPNDRSGGRTNDRAGERGAEAGLSREARQRLDALRADFAADPDRRDHGDGDDRDTHNDVPGGIRLQKVLASAGVGSRRYCEELIADGRVEVDGQIVRRFGARVDPATTEIRVDGQRVVTGTDLVYFALNKPRKVVSTMSDPEGRKSLADFVEHPERLFHVGRLDYDTEGLILLTNDGELAHRLAHPSYEVLKTYLADVPGPVNRKTERLLLREGVELEDGLVRVDGFRVVDRLGDRAMVEVVLHEGRKHIVRRLLAEVGHPVSRLARIQIGPIALGTLKAGTMRALTTKEVSDLYSSVGL